MHSPIRPQKRPRTSSPKIIYRWHRRIGAAIAVFVVWMVFSGWALNHSDSFHLAQTEFHSVGLAEWYGLPVKLPEHAYRAGAHTLIATQDNAIYDNGALNLHQMIPVGMVETTQFVAIAGQHELVLLDRAGQLIDRIAPPDLPAQTIRQVGTGCGGIALQGESDIPLASSDGVDWQPCHDTINWSHSEVLSQAERKNLEHRFAPAISLEKIILDLHSGGFFGRYGRWCVDLIGAGLLALALSGLWLYFRRNTKTTNR